LKYHPLMRAWTSSLLLVLVCGCGEDKKRRTPPPDAGTDAAVDAGTDAGLPDAICNAGSHWTAGTPIFREATDEVGLTGVLGTRMSITDLDGDGWADLVVRGGGPASFVVRNAGGTFEDVTESSGLFAARASGDSQRPGDVAASADVDNDGDLDVLTGTATPAGALETSELMINDGSGVFTLGAEGSDARTPYSPCAVAFVDYDRDGLVDVWIPENTEPGSGIPLQDRLYRGDGAGSFAEVTESVGLTTRRWTLADLNAGLAHSVGWSGAACDLNGDGWTELLASSYGRAPNLLWQGAAGPTFTNRAVASGYAFDERIDWTDNQSARCYCTLHPTAEDCAGVEPPDAIECNDDSDVFRWGHDRDRELYRLGGNSGSTTCADVDNDGDIDLVTGEIVHWDVGASSDPAELLVNSGEADVRFERPGNDVTGLVRTHERGDWNEGIMTQDVFDFDGDGWADVYWGDSDYPGSYGRLYHQESPNEFVAVDVDDFFQHFRSHGVVSADFDRDGDLDMIVGHSFSRCDAECYPTQQIRYFENQMGATGNFVQVRLEGAAGTNAAAIGARVRVEAGGIVQTQEIDGGHGHYGTQKDRVLHFGLGTACEANVTVRWPDASLTNEQFTLPSGYRFRIAQGAAPVVDAP